MEKRRSIMERKIGLKGSDMQSGLQSVKHHIEWYPGDRT